MTTPIMMPVTTILVLIALLFVIWKVLISNKSRLFIIDHLKWVALVVLVLGWGLYWWGYWKYYDEQANLLALTLRSFLSSLGMFALQSDLQYFVQEKVKDAPLFLGVFAVVHFLAVLISAIFIVNFVGTKLGSWIKMRKAAGQDLYIFWGVNDNSITLAQDIYNNNVNGMIVFVSTLQDAELERGNISLSTIISGQSLKKDKIRKIEETTGAIITYCKEEISLTENCSTCNILKSAGLSSLIRIIIKSKDKHIRLFSLSDDETYNIHKTMVLLNAIESNDEVFSLCQQLEIFCHARRNKQNSVLEKMAYVKHDNALPIVHLIDSSSLAIQSLMRKDCYQPVSYVNPDITTATVDNPFTALIIGFGEAGRDALRYLYEFGAFPNSQGEKSPFKCYAIDQKMDQLAGDFYNDAPALVGSTEVELLQMNTHSEPFWKWTSEKIEILNYIVISLGNDIDSMLLAINILEKAIKNRPSMEHFTIFVRSKENETQLNAIANFYNQKASNSMVVFGKQKELFTYDIVIDDEALRHAKEFYVGYASKDPNAPTWDERHIISQKVKTSEGTTYIKKDRQNVTLADINSVIRKERQDTANYRHIDTKLKLAGLNRSSTKDDFDKLTPIQKKNLAICEHLRWNASHEMLGYVLADECSDMLKTHNCLKAWQQLTQVYQSYDYEVMNRTIDIIIHSNENN